MRARSLSLAALSAASLLTLSLTLAVSPARAQFGGGQGPTKIIAAMEFQNTDVRAALRELFRNAGVSFAIDPAVQGTVSVSLRNVPFETALQNLTRQVDATYRIEGGVYQVVKLGVPDQGPGDPPQEGRPFPPRPNQGNDPPAIAVDGNFVFVVQHGMLTKVDKKTMRIVGRVALGPGGGVFGGGRRAFGGGPLQP